VLLTLYLDYPGPLNYIVDLFTPMSGAPETYSSLRITTFIIL